MDRERAVQFVMLGGFLGAGKTTTLLAIARRLAEQGRRVAIVTNDQADDLVDSALGRLQGLPVGEIAGGCFCCRFQDLVDRCQELLDAIRPDVLLAEPVGSCADLSATVLQPLKRYYGEWFRIAPYSVLVDPERLGTVFTGPQAASPVGFLFGKQLEEADLLVLNKQDTLTDAAREACLAPLRDRFPATPVLAMSALTGEGLDAWWQAVLAGPTAGQRLLQIDYDTYAEAEAALGWLNATIHLAAEAPFDAAAVGAELLAQLRHGAQRQVAAIGHVKAVIETAAGAVRQSVVSVAGRVEQTGELSGPVRDAELTLNARVELAPEDLEALVLRGLRRVCNERGVTPTVTRLQRFRPARPTPTHRFTEPG